VLNYRELKKERAVLNVLNNLGKSSYKNFIVDIGLLSKVATKYKKTKQLDDILRKNGVSFGRVVIE
jgi:hypothetical protein